MLSRLHHAGNQSHSTFPERVQLGAAAPAKAMAVRPGAGLLALRTLLVEQLPPRIGDRVDALAVDRLAGQMPLIFEQLQRWVDRSWAGAIETAVALLKLFDQLVAM